MDFNRPRLSKDASIAVRLAFVTWIEAEVFWRESMDDLRLGKKKKKL